MTATAQATLSEPLVSLPISYGRQELILDPTVARNTHITVFGCGTVGSNAAVEAARLGIGRFTLYDFDDVEAHNIPSQRFTKHDMGRKKVDALADQVLAVSNGPEITTQDTKVEGAVMVKPGPIILAVDTMQSRKDIFTKAIKFSNCPLVLDFRMSANLLQCYAFPFSDQRYEATLFDDDDADPAPCGGRTVSYTGALSGCIAANYLRKHLKGDEIPFVTTIDLDLMGIMHSMQV